MLKRQSLTANTSANLLTNPWKNQFSLSLSTPEFSELEIDFSSKALINQVLSFMCLAIGADECHLELIPSQWHCSLFPAINTFSITCNSNDTRFNNVDSKQIPFLIEEIIPCYEKEVLGKIRFRSNQVRTQIERHSLMKVVTPFFLQLYHVLFLQASPVLLKRAYLQMLLRISGAMDKNNHHMNAHASHTAQIARQIANAIGCSQEQCLLVYYGGILHDIGKIIIPETILHKTTPLTDHEWEMIKYHPVIGAGMLSPIYDLSDMVPMIRQHHEWYDGSGYPDHIQGQNITLGGRILAIADAYGTMIDGRVYQNPRSPQEARQELIRYKNIQFDPKLVDAFLSTSPDTFQSYQTPTL